MRILLTNDDGFSAEGINVLRYVLESDGHEVWVVAPSSNRSGASCSITMYRKLSLEKRAENQFALDGSPIDCVISALRGKYLPGQPDVVISGINRDGNIGTDIVYSGTCAAARQASLYGIPGIALSSERRAVAGESEGEFKYEALAHFASQNLMRLIELCGKKRERHNVFDLPYYVNVNAPSADKFSGVKFVSPCRRVYGDGIELTKEDDICFSNCVGLGKIVSVGDGSDDFSAVSEGFIAITCLDTEPSWNNGDFSEKAETFVV